MTAPPSWLVRGTGGLAVAMAVAFGVGLAMPRDALAHTGAPPAPHDVLSSWTLSLPTLLALFLLGWVYARGAARIGRATLRGRRRSGQRGRSVAFGLGILALAVALISPLDVAGASLQSAHMLQHLLLLAVAPPLLVLGAPLVPVLLGLPHRWRRWLTHQWCAHRPLRSAWHLVSGPGPVVVLNVVVLWGWHAAPAYELALRNEPVHIAEHFCFLLAGSLLWWAVLQPVGRRRVPYGIAIALLLTMALQGSALGMLLTFSTTIWYPDYVQTTAPWGLTPLEDQHLAGALMWVPANVISLIGAGAMVLAWIRTAERDALRQEGHAYTPSPPVVSIQQWLEEGTP